MYRLHVHIYIDAWVHFW